LQFLQYKRKSLFSENLTWWVNGVGQLILGSVGFVTNSVSLSILVRAELSTTFNHLLVLLYKQMSTLPSCTVIIMIDSITKLCLSLLVCTNGLSYSGKETWPTLCIKRRQTNLVSEIINEINISCYTEYKAFGPSLIYNTVSINCCKSESVSWRYKQC